MPTQGKAVAAPQEVADEKAELARYYEEFPILKDEKLTEEDEAKVVAAVRELGTLHLSQVAPLLVGKLNAQASVPLEAMQVKTFQLLRTAPQGLLSPVIAQAAAQSLLQIGAPALPALADAVAARGSSARFREDAVKLIVQIAGSKEAAQEVLNQAAQKNNKKAERLRALAATLPEVSAP